MTSQPGETITFDHARARIRSGEEPADVAALVVGGLTDDEKLWCLDGDAPSWAGLDFLGRNGYHKAPFYAAEVTRVGIPGIAFSDGPRGVVVGNATAFPVSMARGATWDPDLEERIGDVIGTELAAVGASLYGGVCVNLLRHPAWGRAQETYGEDPFHVGEMGAALTRGIQRHAMACVKHFAANSMENARFTVDITIDEVALHEVYLKHFERIVDEGVAAVMSAYNAVNGEWCGQSPALLTDVLRVEWGFEGFVISDWIFGMRDAATSIGAGLDIEMPYRMIRSEQLPAALDDGTASWDDVDAAVTRLVATLLRFDDVLSQPAPHRSVLASEVHRRLAREVAGRSVVLLRNQVVDGRPVLPLDRATTSQVAVVGRLADTINLGDGGSSDVWALDCVTVLAGVCAAVPDAVVTHHPGDEIDVAAQAATAADVAIVVVGYTYEDEGEFIGDTDPALAELFPKADDPDVVEVFNASIEDLPPTLAPDHVKARPRQEGFATGGDRTSLRLHPHDVELIRAVAAANARTVVVIQAGSAVLSSEWDREVAAVVQPFYGGGDAGHGLADVLFGDVNPSARLPFSVPTNEAHLPVFERDATAFTYDRWHGWWHLQREEHEPAYPFGFGLSYTTFEHRDVVVGSDRASITVSGVVANTGDRDGADVVQLYASLPDPDAPDRLIGFTRVEVEAGARQPFRIVAPLERLATRDVETHSWRPPRGSHEILVGRRAGDPAAVRATVAL